MLTAIFDTVEEDKTFSLTINGHAGAGEVGNDLVCASASILAYTLAYDVQIHEEMGVLDNVIVKLEEGDSVIKCQCKNRETYNYLRRAFVVISNGFLLLQNDYPENVRTVVW